MSLDNARRVAAYQRQTGRNALTPAQRRRVHKCENRANAEANTNLQGFLRVLRLDRIIRPRKALRVPHKATKHLSPEQRRLTLQRAFASRWSR